MLIVFSQSFVDMHRMVKLLHCPTPIFSTEVKQGNNLISCFSSQITDELPFCENVFVIFFVFCDLFFKMTPKAHSWVLSSASKCKQAIFAWWRNCMLDKLHVGMSYIVIPRWCSGKESVWLCKRHKKRRFNPWIGKIPWSRKLQPTPVFLPGKFHGQRNLLGYSPKSLKELGMIEYSHMNTVLLAVSSMLTNQLCILNIVLFQQKQKHIKQYYIYKESTCQCRRHKRC